MIGILVFAGCRISCGKKNVWVCWPNPYVFVFFQTSAMPVLGIAYRNMLKVYKKTQKPSPVSEQEIEDCLNKL